MTKLNALIKTLLAREVAEVGDGVMIPFDAQADYLRMALARADALLDRRRDAVFFDVLNIPNKTTAQRVALAYDAAYLMGLGLSIDATIELAQELVGMFKRMGVQYPNSWDQLAAGTWSDAPLERVEYPVIRESAL